ncbi:ATP-dependent Clp protease proteolytic subunit [Paraburkholderia aspalathi]|uniref:ATP-dependent Clp protease proteolytic subunit n=1 Tax=Paraburkholderia aspalathi TaxID=1324617 RepID=A0ABM8SHV9_9BURK|nr:head maturation protease, ClpP-related [Paraburkholderia aspalathi]MBK3821776.1 Clp protease ClpP [Paraburkholderia aspalathi]MBK3833620.1 Clp protease ClpP [Paraburkholderia aspalathi]MBK3863343.1 Clp protease ClpP [Paraburkholderia aspalathi]CAE6810945.1 ATP-dependent Clp protease proteolytic subunit [Paraburkholderia aspalathi]
MKNRKWWDIKALTNAQGSAVAEIRIYDEIGFWGTDAKTFVSQLDKAAASAAEVVVAINSPGGDVFDAFAIYNALRRYAGRVTARIDGVAASAASLVAMAGDRIVMPENAMLMIHNPWTVALGTASDLRATADSMDKARDGILAAYRNKSGKSDEELTAMLDAETWMTAAEAKEAGFADEIEAPVKLAATARSADLLARFQSAPSSVLALVEENSEPTATPAETSPANPAEAVEPGSPLAPVGSPPSPAPLDPNPVAVREEPGVLAAHVFNACRAANLSLCAESIVTLTALKDRATIDVAIRNATDIAGLCLAAKLPELTAQFVGDGLNPDQVRARLFDRVTQTQPRVNNRQQPAPGDAGRPVAGPKASSIYAARQGVTK